MDIRSNRSANVALTVAVFAIAVAVRLPSCDESFWVDELHSAWCVWDSLTEVAPRAKLGNQSPFYFVGLWFWKQLLGGGEVAMRLSSVIITSTASAVMTLGVIRWTGSRVGGIAAGVVMALESNAIFFGTELRPYAVVILCASIATICFVELLESDESQPAWNVLVISILVALAMQPTSFGLLSLLPVVIGLKRLRDRRWMPRLSSSNLSLLVVFVAVGWALWSTTLGASWQSRGNWATFAMAPGLSDAVVIWDWAWLWGLPLVVGLWVPGKRPAMVCVALVAIGATLAFWAASRLDVVHLWHRRYLVSVLPMFALLVGGAVGQCRGTLCGRLPTGVLMTALLLLGLTWSQGVLQTLWQRPGMLAYRGEDWRSAVDWVQSRKDEADVVWLDPGLIESKVLSYEKTIEPAPTTEVMDYLHYPVSGPYRLDNVQLIRPISKPVFRRDSMDDSGTRGGPVRSLWVIARASGETASKFAVKVKRKDRLGLGSAKSEVRSFGGVCVIRFVMDIPMAEPQKAVDESILLRG